jgi:putative flippase GtrA
MLVFSIEFLQIKSAGVANMAASVVGISVSFTGNRYFVFKNIQEGFISQAARFSVLYVAIAVLHSTILFFWSDVYGFDYKSGFLIATLFQFLISYLGNKTLVFTR